jgi:hypothetical protein
MIAVFAIFLLLVGGFIAGVGFHDPDTCWLLALGRWITQHGSLPSIDPFSFTHAASGRPFVLYQWLSEVVFYNVQRFTGLTGLLLFAALIIWTSFVALPLFVMSKRGTTRLAAIAVLALGILSAAFHFLVRPEIFSFLFMSIWLALLTLRVNKKVLLFVLPATMILWCNMHTGFVMGLCVLALFVALDRKNWKTNAAALVLCVAATLVNPWGIGLWQYLPSLFFAPFNKFIVELGPVNLHDPTFYPFFALVICSVIFGSWFQSLLFIVLAVTTNRLIPFAALSIVYGIADRAARNEQKQIKTSELPVLCSTLVACLAIGVFLTAKLVPPEVPQNSPNIRVPTAAMTYLQQKRPAGKLFNDPEFGDVLLWRMDQPPQVFIDSRFDMYGIATINDYRTIANHGAGWRQLIDKYGIDWVFVPPKTPIVKSLTADPSWQTLFADDKAVIMQRLPRTVHTL